MRVDYVGKSIDYKYRIAEISCKEKELDKLEEISKIMLKEFSYRIDIVTDGYALCLVDDYDDYKNFMSCWKESKKILKERK